MLKLTLLFVSDYTERIWRYQDNEVIDIPQDDGDYTERIWRYQDNCTSTRARLEQIIPRGFGGIRTTYSEIGTIDRLIIPRGFGGIRTTDRRLAFSFHMIIPRGFGGIRTTRY